MGQSLRHISAKLMEEQDFKKTRENDQTKRSLDTDYEIYVEQESYENDDQTKRSLDTDYEIYVDPDSYENDDQTKGSLDTDYEIYVDPDSYNLNGKSIPVHHQILENTSWKDKSEEIWVLRDYREIDREKKRTKEYIEKETVLYMNSVGKIHHTPDHVTTDQVNSSVSSSGVYDVIDESLLIHTEANHVERITTRKNLPLPAPPVNQRRRKDLPLPTTPERQKSKKNLPLPAAPVNERRRKDLPLPTPRQKSKETKTDTGSEYQDPDETETDTGSEYQDSDETKTDTGSEYQDPDPEGSDRSKPNNSFEERINKYRKEVMEKLIVPQVLPHLHRILDPRDIELVRKTGERINYESATEALLSIMSSSTKPAKWEVFIEGLEAAGHINLAKMLRGEYEHVSEDCYGIILYLAPKLRELIIPHDIMPYLVADSVITKEDEEAIKRKEIQKGGQSAVDLLLDRVHRKHPDWFNLLKSACNNSKHADVLSLLEETEGIPELRNFWLQQRVENVTESDRSNTRKEQFLTDNDDPEHPQIDISLEKAEKGLQTNLCTETESKDFEETRRILVEEQHKLRQKTNEILQLAETARETKQLLIDYREAERKYREAMEECDALKAALAEESIKGQEKECQRSNIIQLGKAYQEETAECGLKETSAGSEHPPLTIDTETPSQSMSIYTTSSLRRLTSIDCFVFVSGCFAFLLFFAMLLNNFFVFIAKERDEL